VKRAAAPGQGARVHLPAYVAAAIGVIALAVYVSTLYPDVPGGDSGELIGAVATGGVIHPPGYPLYSLLGRLFFYLPIGSVAWRLNFFSAVCDAAAAGVLVYAGARWSESIWGGLVAGALFAFAPAIWQYAAVAEVFALDNVLVAVLVLLAVLHDDAEAPVSKRRRLALGIAFVAGLAFSNHQTSVFAGGPIVLWAFWPRRRGTGEPGVMTLPLVLQGVALLAAGLLPYAYLPVLAAHHAPISWGDADTWSGFWTTVLRKEYGTFQLAPSGTGGGTGWGTGESMTAATFTAFAHHVFDQLNLWCLPFAALGLYASVRDGWEKRFGFGVLAVVPPVLAVSVLVTLVNVNVELPLFREVVARFWQLPDIFFFLWCGYGLAFVGKRVTHAGMVALGGGLALAQLGLHADAENRHDNRLVARYGEELLRAAPASALLLTKGDLITSSVRYLQAVDHLRPDVRLVDQELLAFPWYRPLVQAAHPEIVIPGAYYAAGAEGFDLKTLVDANIARGPVLLCGGTRPGDTSADAAYTRWPHGFCERLVPVSERVDEAAWVKSSEDALPKIDFTAQAHPPGSWEDIVWGDYWLVRHILAGRLIALAGHDESKRWLIVEAIKTLQAIVDDDPTPSPDVRKMLAVALGRVGLQTPDEKKRAAQAWRAYLAVAPKEDPMLPAIQSEVRRLEGETRQPASP
jgi:hypothetical protein